MVKTGGVTVREGFVYGYVDHTGVTRYVVPPSEQSGVGEFSG